MIAVKTIKQVQENVSEIDREASLAYGLNDPEAAKFYREVIQLLKDNKFEFLVAGTFAVRAYTNIKRDTKDIDLFCRAGDYLKILNLLSSNGYKTEVEDERWIAKAYKGKHFIDFIFGSANAIAPVDDVWFDQARTGKFFNINIKTVSPQHLIWSKVFVQDRYKFDGADIAHLILKKHNEIDWKWLLSHMSIYWEVLLFHLINFRFIYPSERHLIPGWLMSELLERAQLQLTSPIPQMKTCRGRLFSRSDYQIDVSEWGYADIIGEAGTFKG